MKTALALLLLIVMLLPLGLPLGAQSSPAFDPPILTPYEDYRSGSLGDFESAQLYAVGGLAGDSVLISYGILESSSDYVPLMLLLGSDGSLYTAASAFDSDNPLVEIYFTLPQDDTYYLLLADAYRMDGGEALLDSEVEYELYTSGFSGELRQVDLSGWAFLQRGDEIALPITQNQPLAFAVFEGQADAEISLFLNSSDGQLDPLLYLFAPDGARLAYNDDSDTLDSALENFILPQDGVYVVIATVYGFYAAAEGVWNSDGELRLRLE